MTLAVDHLVVAAASLAQGAAWCEATLGVTPGPGGTHVLFGTHNRLLKIATPTFPLDERGQRAAAQQAAVAAHQDLPCLLYTSPSPRDRTRSRMPSSA